MDYTTNEEGEVGIWIPKTKEELQNQSENMQKDIDACEPSITSIQARKADLISAKNDLDALIADLP